MTAQSLTLCACGLALSLSFVFPRSSAAQSHTPIVRLAELEIDPAQLNRYKAALKEEIETSIRVEPGVLTLYAVAIKENPAQIRLFETCADASAYRAHLESPTSRSTKSPRKAWSSASGSLRPTLFCSVPRASEKSPGSSFRAAPASARSPAGAPDAFQAD